MKQGSAITKPEEKERQGFCFADFCFAGVTIVEKDTLFNSYMYESKQTNKLRDYVVKKYKWERKFERGRLSASESPWIDHQ